MLGSSRTRGRSAVGRSFRASHGRPYGVGCVGVVAVLVVAGVASCGETTPQRGVVRSPAASTAAAGPNDADAALPAPAPPPVQDGLSGLAAADAAAKVIRTFARPDLPQERWFRELSPLLSPAAASDYVGTDPLRVPARRVTGPTQFLPSPSGYVAWAEVPTDVGRYTVLLSRRQQAGPWLAERIVPPPGVGP